FSCIAWAACWVPPLVLSQALPACSATLPASSWAFSLIAPAASDTAPAAFSPTPCSLFGVEAPCPSWNGYFVCRCGKLDIATPPLKRSESLPKTQQSACRGRSCGRRWIDTWGEVKWADATDTRQSLPGPGLGATELNPMQRKLIHRRRRQ